MIRPVLNNMNEAELYLKCSPEARSIDWTTVLPGGLKTGNHTDREILHREGSYVTVPETDQQIPRADVARFIIKVAEERMCMRNCVAIGIKM